MEKLDCQAGIAERIVQIRSNLYGGNNRKMANSIGENENVLGSICLGNRPPGLSTILKIVNSNPDIDANWLLTGRIPRPAVLPYKNDEESLPVAAEEPAEYGNPPDVHTDGCPWERYDAAQQEIGSLRTRLEQSAESVARLLKENSELRKNPVSPSPATPEAPILI